MCMCVSGRGLTVRYSNAQVIAKNAFMCFKGLCFVVSLKRKHEIEETSVELFCRSSAL